MATLLQLRTLTRKLIQEPTSALLTDDQIDEFINVRKDEVDNEILDINESYFGEKDTTIDLVNGTDSYSLPDLDADDISRVMRIRRIEIAYDGTTFYRALPIHITQLPQSNFIGSYFTNVNPRYYIFGNKLFLLPTPTSSVSNAVRIWYIQRPDELSEDDDTPAFPKQYHRMLAFGAAADIKLSDGAAVVDTDDAVFADRFEKRYQDQKELLRKSIQPRDVSTTTMVTQVDGVPNFTPENSVEPGSLV